MIGTSNICHTLADLEGPYKTKQECIARAYEIGADLPEYMPNFQAMKYKCVEIEDDEGKVRTNYGNKDTQRHNEGSHDKWGSQTIH
jgi:hypothetical protein